MKLQLHGFTKRNSKAPTLPKKQNREGWGTLKISRPVWAEQRDGKNYQSCKELINYFYGQSITDTFHNTEFGVAVLLAHT